MGVVIKCMDRGKKIPCAACPAASEYGTRVGGTNRTGVKCLSNFSAPGSADGEALRCSRGQFGQRYFTGMTETKI